MVEPATADPNPPTPRITKKQTSLACKRCRGRKQRCNNNRPCNNCVRAKAVCVSSERQPRTNQANPQYTRSLETRILELEAQINEGGLETRHGSSRAENQIEDQEQISSSTLISNHRHQESIRVPPADPEIQTPITIQASSVADPSFRNESSDTRDPETVSYHAAGHKEITFSRQREQRLIQTYLERVNPRYPFLHERTFLSWYQSWKDSNNGFDFPVEEQWKSFFVTMAFSVGLLIAPQVSPEDRHTSNCLYSNALSYLGAVFSRPYPVLHVQAYLMCTIHALHSPSSQTVLTMISTTMRCCVISQLHLSAYELTVQDSSSLLEVQIRRRVFWSTYSIDRLISWIYHVPCSLADENIQTELFANASDDELRNWESRSQPQAEVEFTPRQTQVSSALHLIRVRRIQSQILGIMMRADFEATHASSHGWRLHMLEDLDQWRRQLQPHSDPHSRGYTSQGWVGMAYNYTILLLYRPNLQNVCGLVGERCLRACTDILSCFRQYQKDRQTAQLWPGLLSQFGIGITILYCLWATPPSCRSDTYHSPSISTAIRICSVILAVFAEQWKQAEPLRDLFDTLSETIPFHNLSTMGDFNGRRIPAASMDWIKSMMPHIISLVVNRDICRMITEIVSEKNPWQDSGHNHHFQEWSWNDVHSPLDCQICQDRGISTDREIAATLQEGFGSLEAGIGGPLHVLEDEFLSFPGLFGSAEF